MPTEADERLGIEPMYAQSAADMDGFHAAVLAAGA